MWQGFLFLFSGVVVAEHLTDKFDVAFRILICAQMMSTTSGFIQNNKVVEYLYNYKEISISLKPVILFLIFT